MSENFENDFEKVSFGKRAQKHSRVTLVDEVAEEVETQTEEPKENVVDHVEMVFEKEPAPFVVVAEDTKEELKSILKEDFNDFEDDLEPITLLDDEVEEPKETVSAPKEQEELEPIILLKEPEEGFLKEDAVEILDEVEQPDLLRADAQEEEIEYTRQEEIEYSEDDLFYEKKSFLLTQYEKEEKYLEKKSSEGYHFVRKVGKKYYFVQGDKTPYYYNIAYFKNEPSDELWDQWDKLGWKLMCRTPSKKKKEAGWFYFRHLEVSNEYRRTIENEEEKYNFYRKYANSCRSTVFFLFVCMAVCAVSAYLQWQFHAMWAGIIVSGVIFAFSFILFLSYLRMMMINRRTARKLRIQLRLQQRRKNFHGEDYDPETDAQLETDWNELESEKESKKKRKGK